MLMSVLQVVLVAGAAALGHTDTSFVVPAGSRLALNNFAGTVVVRAWPRNAVRIRATHPEPVRVIVTREGNAYDVRARDPNAPHARRQPQPQPPVNYDILAPAWMPLDLEGFHCDMDIDGSQSEVMAETVRGGVRLRGGAGLIRLSSMTGGVDVRGARGRMQLSSVESPIGVHDVTGEISIEAVNGNVVLERVQSRLVDAATVNGDVQFTGWMVEDGRYKLATHRGNLDVMLPRAADATVLVSTFRGGFRSGFPVRPSGPRPGRNFVFTLGDGRAVLDLNSFEGRINVDQGELPPPPPPPPVVGR